MGKKNGGVMAVDRTLSMYGKERRDCSGRDSMYGKERPHGSGQDSMYLLSSSSMIRGNELRRAQES
jgi:hypothetical protein